MPTDLGREPRATFASSTLPSTASKKTGVDVSRVRLPCFDVENFKRARLPLQSGLKVRRAIGAQVLKDEAGFHMSSAMVFFTVRKTSMGFDLTTPGKHSSICR